MTFENNDAIFNGLALLPRLSRLSFNLRCAHRLLDFIVTESISTDRVAGMLSKCKAALELCRTENSQSAADRAAVVTQYEYLEDYLTDDNDEFNEQDEIPDAVLEGLIMAVRYCLAEVAHLDIEDPSDPAINIVHAIENSVEDDRYSCYDKYEEVDVLIEEEVRAQKNFIDSLKA